MKKILCTLIGVFFLQATAVLADLDPLQDYDNFNAKKYNGCKWCIDTDKWYGGHRGMYTGEVMREIKGKRLRMSHRSWGGTDSDSGAQTGRTRLLFRDSENISGVCFVPRVQKYEINSCKGNGATASAQIRYIGNFYDADNTADDGETGLVYAWFGLRRWHDSNIKKGYFHVSGGASQCADEDCTTDAWSTYDAFNDPNLFFTDTKGNKNKKEFCVGYDRVNHELVFSYGNEVRTVNGPDHGLPAFDADVESDLTWHTLEARTDVHNCSDDRLTGYVYGDFDNVKIREF